jgi:Bacterial Ig domain/Putative Ig domain/S-layer homology domain
VVGAAACLFALAGWALTALADTVATQVATVDTGAWAIPAPGPAGVAYRSDTNTLIVVDSDRNNMSGFDGVDLWEYSLDTGEVVYTGVLPTTEPTGVEYDAVSGSLFVSSDKADGTLLVVHAGADGKFGTPDDPTPGVIPVTDDVEDPALDTVGGHLFVLIGESSLIIEVDPIDGVFGNGNDTIASPVAIPHPVTDPSLPHDWEGLAYDPSSGHLIAGAKFGQVMYEFTTAFAFVAKHDLSAIDYGLQALSGLTSRPPHGVFPTTFWVADRGDTQDGTTLDGALIEVTLGPAPQMPPVAKSQTVNTNVGQAKAITLMATDINHDALTYSAGNPPHGTLSGSGPNLTYTPDHGFSGADSFTFTASDGAPSNTATVTINVNNRAPNVFNPGSLLHGEGGVVSVAMFATDPDPAGTPPATLTWTATNLPPGLSINPASGQIAGTISIGAAAGSPYSVTVKATDNGTPKLSSQVGFSWAIVDTNHSPVMTPIGDKPVKKGSHLAFKATATDSDGDGLAFSLVSPPTGATITSAGNFGWTPSQAPGSYPITVKVVDDGTPSLSAQVTFTVTVTAATPTPNPDIVDHFTDDDGHIFEAAIEWLASKGITQGCNPPANTHFCPNDFVTRGQMAAFLVRAFGYTDNGGGNLFTDDNGNIFENAIDKLATAGVTVGCNPPANTHFCPNLRVTRGQMAAFLVRAFHLTNAGKGNLFIDDNGSVFEHAIDILGTAKITLGCNPPTNNKFCPNSNVTRGQMAAFLKRAFGE